MSAVPSSALSSCRVAIGIDETDAKFGAIWNRANRQQQQTIIRLSGAGLDMYAGEYWSEIPCRYRSIIMAALIDLRERLVVLLPPDQFPAVVR